jgi:SAM-dependent methyltransferase
MSHGVLSGRLPTLLLLLFVLVSEERATVCPLFAASLPSCAVPLHHLRANDPIPIRSRVLYSASCSPTALNAPTQLDGSCAVKTFCYSDRILRVTGLDWYQPQNVTLSLLVDAMHSFHGVAPHIVLKDLPERRKARDLHKFHAGSATISFTTPEHAQQAMLAMQGQWTVSWLPIYPKPVVPAPTDSPATRTRRLLRAQAYARRRQRIAQATDEILKVVLQQHPDGSVSEILNQVPTLAWSQMPAAMDPVRGGKLNPYSARGLRKQFTVETFISILNHTLLVEDQDSSSLKRRVIADLGCGAGNLAIPLAWWLQQEQSRLGRRTSLQVLGVDMNVESLSRLQARSKSLELNVATLQTRLEDLLVEPGTVFDGCAAIVSLHACGSASDLALAIALQHQLPFVISPCCIGKVKKAWQAATQAKAGHPISTGDRAILRSMPPLQQPGASSDNQVTYPRSQWLRHILTMHTPNMTMSYQLLAAAADYGGRASENPEEHGEQAHGKYEQGTDVEGGQVESDIARRDYSNDERRDDQTRHHRGRLAKRIVEWDRLQWVYEHQEQEQPRNDKATRELDHEGYYVRLVELPSRIDPWYPKRELLLGAPKNSMVARRMASLSTLTVGTMNSAHLVWKESLESCRTKVRVKKLPSLRHE